MERLLVASLLFFWSVFWWLLPASPKSSVSSVPGFLVHLFTRGLVGEGKVEQAFAEDVANSALIDLLSVPRDEARVTTVNFLLGVVLKKGVAPRVGALPRRDLVAAHVGDVEGFKVD